METILERLVIDPVDQRHIKIVDLAHEYAWACDLKPTDAISEILRQLLTGEITFAPDGHHEPLELLKAAWPQIFTEDFEKVVWPFELKGETLSVWVASSMWAQHFGFFADYVTELAGKLDIPIRKFRIRVSSVCPDQRDRTDSEHV